MFSLTFINSVSAWVYWAELLTPLIQARVELHNPVMEHICPRTTLFDTNHYNITHFFTAILILVGEENYGNGRGQPVQLL